MKKYRLLMCAMLITCFNLQAQIITTPITSDTVLINYLQGFGLTITNMSITAPPQSLALYTDSGNSIVTFGNGIIMSTGKIDSTINNAASALLSTDNQAPGNAAMNNITNGVTYDACTIDFDCVPTSANLLFDFAFASEEYPEFVQQYNDGFAILVSGPNPTGGSYTNKNFALIPATTVPVSINNVNPSSIGHSYYIDNFGSLNFAFDGYTTGLQGLVPVIPGQSYHFKISVADNFDGIYDSAVLLKTYSFRTAVVTGVSQQNLSDDIAIYPIPAKDIIYYRSSKFKVDRAELYSVDGKKMENLKSDASTSSIDTKGLESGIYFIHLFNDQEMIVKKVVIN